MKLWKPLVLLCALLAAPAWAQSTLYVNCETGSDANDGSIAQPLLTLNKARDLIRAKQPLSAPFTVELLPSDCYPRDPSTGAVNFNMSVLDLQQMDSGSAGATITYTTASETSIAAAVAAGSLSASATGPGRLLGGVSIPASAWKPYKAGIFQVDLGPGGLNVAQYGFGSFAPGALGQCHGTIAELFFGEEAMVVARWPNIAPNGTWQWAQVQSVPSPLSFVTNQSRVATWAGQPGAWVHGYWKFDWADSYCEIASVEGVAGGSQISINAATPPVYGVLPQARFYGVNLFSELDVESEYYIDAAKGVLYFIPPGGDPTSSETFLSLAPGGITSGPSSVGADRPRLTFSRDPDTLVTDYHVPATPDAASRLSYITLSGFDIQYTRGVGISIPNADHVTISGMNASNHGHTGVSISGTNNVVNGVTVAGVGCEAFAVGGGDMPSITPGNNVLSNSVATKYARTVRTYNGGVAFHGVSNTYSGNTVSHAPQTGMVGSGVLNTFIGNTFDHLCYEVSDSGAFYSGKSWTNRGNALVHNTFSNIRMLEPIFLGYLDVNAIYLDDQLSGTIVRNNTCYNAQTCYWVGGGRDTIIAGNSCNFTDTCVWLDNRGMTWQSANCAYNSSYTGVLVQGLFDVNYKHPPYSTSFPSIVDTLENYPCVPVNVSITDNTYCNAKTFLSVSEKQWSAWYDFVGGNTASC